MSEDLALQTFYRRVRTIGTGGTANLYVATQLTLDRPVVIKEVYDLRQVFPHVDVMEVLTRLQAEVRRAARLSHPNIVSILEADTGHAPPCIVSEYVEGQSLRQLIDKKELSAERVTQIFLQVLHALRYAHQQGVFHCGLKPENVLIDGMGNARITDFGLANLHTQAARPPLHIDTGPIAYLAPEVFEDPLRSSPQIDLYALGVLLYEALSGRIPGRRSKPPTSIHPELPPAYDEIFNRLTLDDPNARYQSADQVLEDCDYSDVKSTKAANASFFFDRPA